MRVEEVMTRSAWTCCADDPLSVPAQLMWDHDVGAVPVLGANDAVVGIVTDRDLCMAANFTGQPLSAVPVSHAMSRVVFTVEPGQSLESAEELMRSRQVHRLPVVEAGRIVGIITLGDLARASSARKQVGASEVIATLAAIVEPRQAPVAAAA
jgi:CBS-domain-containing membrane protein